MVAPTLFSGWQPQSRRQGPRRSRCLFFLPWKLSPLTARLSAASPFRASAERPLPDWSILQAFTHQRMSSTDTIRELNDAFRTTFRGNGDVYLTAAVAALPTEEQGEIIQRVQRFDTFTPENDPHDEHDFGSFELCGRRFFWKIDLYEEPGVKSENGEPVVNRVLTIMLADEY